MTTEKGGDWTGLPLFLGRLPRKANRPRMSQENTRSSVWVLLDPGGETALIAGFLHLGELHRAGETHWEH